MDEKENERDSDEQPRDDDGRVDGRVGRDLNSCISVNSVVSQCMTNVSRLGQVKESPQEKQQQPCRTG